MVRLHSTGRSHSEGPGHPHLCDGMRLETPGNECPDTFGIKNFVTSALFYIDPGHPACLSADVQDENSSALFVLPARLNRVVGVPHLPDISAEKLALVKLDWLS
jgi:hypothetical protein